LTDPPAPHYSEKDPVLPTLRRLRAGPETGPGSLQEGHGTAADAWALHRPRGRDVGIMAVAVVGISLSAPLTTMLAAPAGDGLALLGAFCAGGYVLAGARARQRLSTSAYAVICYSVCAVAVAVAAVVVGDPLVGFAARDWLLIAAITVCAQLLGHTLLNLLLSSVGPTMVSLVILLEVPGALLFALVLLQQVPPPLALPGVALVVVGVGLVVRASRPAALAEPGT
jgi:drug/metabolite transporter (DMT)-like permease